MADFQHPPYSPDLVPSDYYLFPNLKRHLDGMRFTNDLGLQTEVSKFFAECTPGFLESRNFQIARSLGPV